VTGETRSSNFAIDVSHQPVALTTEFVAVVDGTNGDTLLERVRATLIRSDPRVALPSRAGPRRAAP
jgi:hypothetical protein